MKIAVDAYNIALEHGTGVATYGRNLISAVASLDHEIGVLYGATGANTTTSLLNEIALIEGDSLLPRLNLWSNTKLTFRTATSSIYPLRAKQIYLSGQVIVPPSQRLDVSRYWNIRNLYRRALALYRVSAIPSKVQIDELDVAHWTYPLPIEACGARNVYTLHDLVPLKLPYTTADRKRTYYRLCKRIAERADHILTVSESSRNDIIEILGVSEDRVTNAYQSVDAGQLIEGIEETEIETYVNGLLNVEWRGYFLYFGAIEPKKNLARLLEAYLSSGVRTPLVVVGAPGWGGEKDTKLLASLRALGAEGRIIWLGYLPRTMLVKLIAGARATLFPSLYEGFGLPVAESMALGTPVITSNTSSLPEVAGDAALKVDPYDTAAMSAAIRQVDADEDLRFELSEHGRIQAAKFSPEQYREKLRSVYQRLL